MSLQGDYSSLVIYNENKRYYFMQNQRNKPLLDVELRHMDKARFDGTRRMIQSLMGDVASPLETYSTPLSSANKAFKIVQANDTEFGLSSTTTNNFAIVGGDGSLNNPGILYFYGIYVFFKGHVLYKNQGDTGSLVDDGYTKTAIPSLTTPLAGNRTDIVYLDISFEEAGALAGTTYEDSELFSPTIGTPTANRLRAVFDVRVYEGWTQATDQTVFSNSFFGYFPGPIEHYKVPVAILNRPGNTSSILNSYIVDLLDREEKRVLTPKEITWNTRHGGATGLGELWDSIGQNEGFSNRALNDDSVTPRILQDTGKYKVDSLVAGATGVSKAITRDPANLISGEVASDKSYASNFYAGVTGSGSLSSFRNIRHRVYTDTFGLTGGDSGVAVRNRGIAGINSFSAGSDLDNPKFVVDHQGYLALQKSSAIYPFDLAGTGRVEQDFRIQQDLYVSGQTIVESLFVGAATQFSGNVLVGAGVSVQIQTSLYVYGSTNLDTLTLSGQALFNASVYAYSTLDVVGVATFTAQPIMYSLTSSLPVFSDSSLGLVSNPMTGTEKVVMSDSPSLTGTLDAEKGLFISDFTLGSSSLVVGAGLAYNASTGAMTLAPTSFTLSTAASLTSTLTVTEAITAEGGVVFNGGGSNLNYYLKDNIATTVVGYASTTGPTYSYERIGDWVHIFFPSFFDESTSSAFNIYPLPTEITPATRQVVPMWLRDNGTEFHGIAQVDTNNRIYFGDVSGNTTSWTASGSKGWGAATVITYRV